ncbi:MAG: glycosyltransferase family 4 protein [Steroidobacteraceae bacterium]
MTRPTVLVAHPGTQHARYLVDELHRAEFTVRFACGGYLHRDSALGRLAGALAPILGLGRQLDLRTLDELPADAVHSRLLLELAGLALTKAGARAVSVYRRRNELFQRSISRRLVEGADIVVGFDTSSRLLAQRARDAGKRFVLDQTIGHPRSLRDTLDRLDERYPDWSAPRERKTDAEIALERKEHALAHRIVAPSTFVARTLQDHGVPASKVRVIPFGADTSLFKPAATPRASRELRFLFAGSFSARKGVPVLLEAWRQLAPRRATLALAGTGSMPASARRGLPESVVLLGPLDRGALARAFAQADVFVFPSLFEGMALVQLEAAAAGLPVIGTTASGAEDIVEPGRTGEIVPPGDAGALAAVLDRLISAPEQAREMQRLAAQRSAQWSWSAHGRRWAEFLAGSMA